MKRYNLEKFTYDTYLKLQQYRADQKWGANARTLKNSRENLKEVWEKIQLKDNISVGCMGIRNGSMEFSLFRELLPKSEIIGVDISEKVKEVEGEVYCCDFNHLPKEWAEKFDLLYSNSIDHSYNIKQTIREWRRVVKDKGCLLLAFSTDRLGYADLYNFEEKDIPKLFPKDKVKILKVLENEIYALVRKK